MRFQMKPHYYEFIGPNTTVQYHDKCEVSFSTTPSKQFVTNLPKFDWFLRQAEKNKH